MVVRYSLERDANSNIISCPDNSSHLRSSSSASSDTWRVVSPTGSWIWISGFSSGYLNGSLLGGGGTGAYT